MGLSFLFVYVPCDFFFLEHRTFASNNVMILEIKFCPFPGFSDFPYCFYFILFSFVCLTVIGCLCAEAQPLNLRPSHAFSLRLSLGVRGPFLTFLLSVLHVDSPGL